MLPRHAPCATRHCRDPCLAAGESDCLAIGVKQLEWASAVGLAPYSLCHAAVLEDSCFALASGDDILANAILLHGGLLDGQCHHNAGRDLPFLTIQASLATDATLVGVGASIVLVTCVVAGGFAKVDDGHSGSGGVGWLAIGPGKGGLDNRLLVAFAAIEVIQPLGTGVDVVRGTAVGGTPIAALIKELVDITVGTIADLLQSMRATPYMGYTGLVWCEPVDVVWPQAAHWANHRWFVLLVQREKASDTCLGNCLVHHLSLLDARLRASAGAILEHHGGDGLGGGRLVGYLEASQGRIIHLWGFLRCHNGGGLGLARLIEQRK